MKQQPDKIFREKLNTYYKPAPAGAWNKIEAGLRKKNHSFPHSKSFWLKIAASLFVAALATYILWPPKPSPQFIADKTETVVKPKEQSIKQQPIIDENATSEESSATITEENEIKNQQQKNIRAGSPHAKEKSVINIKEQKPLLTNQETPTIDESQNQEPIPFSETQFIETTVAVSTQHEQGEKITLVFSAEEVNDYLDKKALAQATSADKKSSTFKKLLKKAADLKTNQDPFGDLRQKKNEILALNFKSNERGQNK